MKYKTQKWRRKFKSGIKVSAGADMAPCQREYIKGVSLNLDERKCKGENVSSFMGFPK